VDAMALVDDSVGFIFYLFLLVFRETFEVSDVKVSLVLGLFSTVLPDVGT
jgi:hypothetical protein